MTELRPPQKRIRPVPIRLTQEEFDSFHGAAMDLGMTLSEWFRQLARAAAKRRR